jgi:hypothetical protein
VADLLVDADGDGEVRSDVTWSVRTLAVWAAADVSSGAATVPGCERWWTVVRSISIGREHGWLGVTIPCDPCRVAFLVSVALDAKKASEAIAKALRMLEADDVSDARAELLAGSFLADEAAAVLRVVEIDRTAAE